MIRVLVVEDEAVIAEAHRTFTERIDGFTCVGAVGTVREAVQALRSHQAAGEPVDLVLLDIGLPDASGIEVAVASHHLRPAPDIIVISADRDLAVVRDAVARGAALYLLKPFTFASFRERLENYRTFRESLVGPRRRVAVRRGSCRGGVAHPGIPRRRTQGRRHRDQRCDRR